MNKIFTYVAFILFLVLCGKILYENNASLLSETRSSVVAVRSIEKKESVAMEKNAEEKEVEIDYLKVLENEL